MVVDINSALLCVKEKRRVRSGGKGRGEGRRGKMKGEGEGERIGKEYVVKERKGEGSRREEGRSGRGGEGREAERREWRKGRSGKQREMLKTAHFLPCACWVVDLLWFDVLHNTHCSHH